MRNRKGEECAWHSDPTAHSNLDTLQTILNCASVQGCDHCVSCSEQALEMFRSVARSHRA